MQAVEVRGLGKKQTRELGQGRRYAATDIVHDLRMAPARPAHLRPGEFWALKDVDLTVAAGEAVGVIGHNGAGKSTLLRVLHGLTRPDAGTVDIRGRHAALLDLGAPFNRVLTGRENVETAAALHGMPRADRDELIERVADFAELGEVMDAPMWGYSTGMQMRLGYAIAAQLDPAVLLVDEIIAVGDIAFQRKCVAHVRQHLARGGSLVLVSHDLWMIQALCHRCILLSEGRVVDDTTPNHAISLYLREGRRGEVFVPRTREGFGDPSGAEVSTIDVHLTRCGTASGADPSNGDEMTIEVQVGPVATPRTVRWHVDLLTANRQVCVARLGPDPAEVVELGPEGLVLTCTVRSLPLLPGTFFASAHVVDADTGAELGRTELPLPFEVSSRYTRLDTLAQMPGALALASIEATYSLADPAAT